MQPPRAHYQIKPVLGSLALVLVCTVVSARPSNATTAEVKPAISTPQAVPSAKAIASEIVATYGGKDVLKGVNDNGYRLHVTVSAKLAFSDASNSVESDIYCQGDKLRVETAVRGLKNIMAYDGKVCWTQQGNWVSASTPQQTKEFTEDISHGIEQLASFEDPGINIELRDSQNVAGKACDVLVMTGMNGKSTTFFADKKTHLIAKSEYLGVDHEQGLPAVHSTEYDDWRPVDGTLMPFKLIGFTGGRQHMSVLVNRYESAKLAPDIFTMPPESEIAEIKRDPVVLPFEYVGEHIIVNAKINRQLDCKLLVDTGAAVTALHQAFAQRLGTVSTSNLKVGTVSKAVNTNYAVIESLSLGRVTVNDISAVVGDFPLFSEIPGEHPIGLLGADVLKRFLVTINFQEKTLTLSDPKQVTVPPNAIVLSTSPIFSNAIVVSGRVDDKRDLNFLVDTGASMNHLPSSAAQALVPGPILSVGEVRGLGKSIDQTGAAVCKTLKLAGFTVKNPVFTLGLQNSKNGPGEGVMNASSIGILGVPLWSNFICSIDYINGRIILEPLPEFVELQEYESKCDAINLKYLQTGDFSGALAAYTELQRQAKEKNLAACQALILSETGYCCTTQYLRTKSASFLQQATHYFQEAYNLPVKSNRRLKAHILALWAFLELQTESEQSLINARDLLLRADGQAKNEASTYAVLGFRLFQNGNDATAKPLIKQSLILDPANWIGLETAYKLFGRQGDKPNQAMTLAQMKRYYPGVPSIVAIEKQLSGKK
jgi:predicted aspartyl protease